MTRLPAFVFFLFAFAAASAQSTSIRQTNHHEIAIDASPFLSQIFYSISNNQVRPYNLLYRYNFEKFSFRTKVGGIVQNSDQVDNDTTTRKGRAQQYSLSFGLEKSADFTKHWQFYWGIDIRADYIHTIDIIENPDSHTQRHETKRNRYGASPFIGFRFKINQRMSFTTESSLIIQYLQGFEKIVYAPDNQYGRNNKIEGFRLRFDSPFNISFNYNF